MKRLFAALLCFFGLSAHAAECDLVIRQLDAWGQEVPRLAFVPSGCSGAPGFVVYDIASTQPRIFTFNSTLAFNSGVVGVSPTLLSTKYDQPTGTTSQYIRGDGSLSLFPDLSSYATTSALTSGLAGKYNTPTGTSGQYVRGDGTLATFPAFGSGTVTSVGVSSSNLTVTGSPVTASGVIAVSLPNVGTSGIYSTVSTDAQGRVVAGNSVSINDNPARSLVTSTSATGFQVSATRNSFVCYEGSFSTTSTIGGPSSASVFLETADTNSTTPGDWTTKAQQTYTNTITLAVVLNQVQGNNWSLCRMIPAAKYVRIRSGSITGTASASIGTQQETLQ